MSIIKNIANFFTFKEPEKNNVFMLPETSEENMSDDKECKKNINTNSIDHQKKNEDNQNQSEDQKDEDKRKYGDQNDEQNQDDNLDDKKSSVKVIKKRRNRQKDRNKNNGDIGQLEGKSKQNNNDEEDYSNVKISLDIDDNKRMLEKIFHLPENKDLIIKEFCVLYETELRAMAVFIDGMVDNSAVHNAVLKPLMVFSNINRAAEKIINNGVDASNANSNLIEDFMINKLLITHSVKKNDTFGQAINNVLGGNTVVFVEGCQNAIFLETKGWKDRAVEQPVNEKTIKGPHEAFVENFRTNTGLIHKLLPNKDLVTDILTVGSQQNSFCAIMYLSNIANPLIVKEVKRRVSSLQTDFIAGSGGLEQFIEDHPYMPIPQVLTTERPDRVVSSLLEGRVALVLSNSPDVIIVPISFWTLFHSPEDAYLKVPFGTFLRTIRLFAMCVTLFLSATYVAVITFHQEMIPTDLLMGIAGVRESIPFPVIVEVLLLEISFELIREAGVRIPGAIGPTIGIVGAIILGQAVVAAGIVSPIIIVVVSITALGSFAIPDYTLSFAFRFLRFIYIIVASMLGLVGISIVALMQLALTVNMRSFGVPFLAPIAPKTRFERDMNIRYPAWEQEERPDSLNAKKVNRQPKISRGWTESSSVHNEKGD